jgi:fatty acid desaturase
LFAALLLGMTLLQGNDPDAFGWMALYGVAAALCAAAAAGWRVPRLWAGAWMVLLLGCAGWFGARYLAGDARTPMHGGPITADTPWWKIEEAREAVGLLITAALLAPLLLPKPAFRGRNAG